MDARPRISLGAAPPPSLISTTTSSSGSFPIRAPPTLDDDEPSDFDSNFPDATSSNCSVIYSNSSSYNGFESGEDYETPPQSQKHEDGSDRNIFFRPFVAVSDPEDYEIAEESGNVDKNLFFRPFVADTGDEIVEDGVGVDNNRFRGPFVGDNEMVDNVFFDKDHFFSPFVVDPDDQIVEDDTGIGKNRLFRPFVADPFKEMEQDNACVVKDGFFRPFVVEPEDEIIDDAVGSYKNLLFRPFVADLDKETMEENGCVDEDGFFSYAAESDEDSSVAEREDDVDEIFSNFKIKAKDNAGPDRFVSMPFARLSLEFEDETEFSIIEDFGGATVEGQEKAGESTIKTMGGWALETEPCSISTQQFDPLGMDSSEQSAEKDANESSIRKMGGSVLETESCSISIQQFDPLGTNSSEQSAEKDANESSIRKMGGSALETESCSISIQQFDPLGMDSSEQSVEIDANESSIRKMGISALETGSCSVSIQQFDPVGMDSSEQSAEKDANESSTRTMGGPALETETCSVSIRPFDSAGMDSSEQSAVKDSNETAFLCESVTETAAIDDNTEKSSKPILDEDADPTGTASKEKEIDNFSQLEPIEDNEDLEEPFYSSSFFNFTRLIPDSGAIVEDLVFDMNVVDIGHKDAEEKEVSSSERTNLENMQLLKLQFLRFIHKLGFSAEDPTAAHVLNLLNLAAKSPSFQHLVIDEDAIEGKSMHFSLHILVLGKSGVGKSSIINSMFQEQRVEIDPFEPATRTVKEVLGTLKNGIKVRIFDTPGLRQSTKEQGFNRKTLASVKKLLTKFRVDAVLYVDRLDSYDDSYNDLPLLQTISDSLGASIWRKVVFVYTHAMVEESPLSYREFVRQRHNVIQRCICDAIIQPILLIENNDCCEKKSQDRMLLLLCCSMKTMNEVCSSLVLSGDRQWKGDSQVLIDARFSAGRGFVVGLDVKRRRNWKITVGGSFLNLAIPSFINFGFLSRS